MIVKETKQKIPGISTLLYILGMTMIALGLIGMTYSKDKQSTLKDITTIVVSKHTTKIVTPIVDDTVHHVIRHTSYEDVSKYRIVKYNGKYVATLPYGTTVGAFNTAQEAQDCINSYVETAKQAVTEGSW